jgi:DNA primase
MPFDPACIEVEDYLDCLDIRNVRRATEKEWQFSCPLPAHVKADENPSAYMNDETTAFFCHSCHAKGNAVSLAAQILGVSPLESTRMLKQRYSPAGIDPDSRSMVEEIRLILEKKPVIKRENVILDESVLDRYRVDWKAHAHTPWAKYMWERGFSVGVLEEWEFGFSSKHNRITLPIRDENGNLVGIKARAMNNRKPKYLNLRDENIEPYLKNEIVFALYRVPADRDHLIIVEGEYNAIAMHYHGYINTVAINGSYFGDRQMRLIKERAERVTLFFDSDQAGRDATEAVAEALSPYMTIFIAPDHDGDPAQMHPYTIHRCVAEAASLRQLRLARS